MINRNLIRIRIVQIVYSWYQNTNKDLRSAEKELLFGLQKSHDLYFYLLSLMVELTKAYESRVEAKKNKHLPSWEDLNPNTHLIDNNSFSSCVTTANCSTTSPRDQWYGMLTTHF